MKVCPRCRREYPDNLNFCFDDGRRLEEAASSEVRVCPKCLLRFSADAAECHRDQVPLVSQAELERARERVCSECGVVGADPTAEFCGTDGARVVARWEVGLVPQTAVSPARSAADTRPDRPPDPTDAPANLATPRSREQEEPGAATEIDASPAGPTSAEPPPSASGSGWFLGHRSSTQAEPSIGGQEARFASGSSFGEKEAPFASASSFEAMEPLPTRVSRPLIAATVVSALLFFGALAFALYTRNPDEGTQPAGPATSKAPAPAVTAPPATSPAPTPTPVPAAAAAVAAPEKAPVEQPKSPEPDAAAPQPTERRAVAPPPSAPVARRRATRRAARRRATTRRRVVRRRAVVRRSEPDPTAELAAALRRASAAGRSARAPSEPPPARVAPATTAPTSPPKPKRLSRADANRYFREAAREYGAGRPAEALRRFRIIERLGPRDRDLQGRVLLNMAHIHQGQQRCATSRRYYERAVRLLPGSSSLRAAATSGLRRLGQTCR